MKTSSIYQAIIPAPFGAFGIRCDENIVEEIVYLPPRTRALAPRNALAERAVKQLGRYLADPDYGFDLPLRPVGTAFQQRVWKEISRVPRGSVTSYGALAKKLRSAPRAVGQACGTNFFPPIIPCHRVISASGGIGGFAHNSDGFLIDTKRWLLAHEECPL